MKFIDFFAGIGGFRRGMELAGHECVGFCEFDKYAAASYISMHLITNEQRKYLATMTMKQRQKEILKDEYRNGEWYANDIRNVDARSLPEADCWCFGAPCQSFSLAGKRAGLEGESGLVREIFRLLNELQEEDRPEWLIYENVKGMLSSNQGWDYAAILSEMEQGGYDIEWQNINSSWFVPQNRERIYTVGHLRRYGRRKVLPITGADGENSIQVIATTDSNRHSTGDIHSVSGIMSDCTARDYKQPKQVCIKIIGEVNSSQDGQVHDISGVSKCHSAGHNNSPKVAIPVITPDRTKKLQNGRRFKENGEPMFTLTAQDRHGVGVNISGHNVMGMTDICNCLNANDQRKVFGAKQERTLACMTFGVDINECIKYQQGIYVQLPNGVICYSAWYEKEQCYITIRKLTPKECFRLQGWTDDYFEKAAFLNSDSQLYKQAGNGVTVPVVHSVAKKIADLER